MAVYAVRVGLEEPQSCSMAQAFVLNSELPAELLKWRRYGEANHILGVLAKQAIEVGNAASSLSLREKSSVQEVRLGLWAHRDSSTRDRASRIYSGFQAPRARLESDESVIRCRRQYKDGHGGCIRCGGRAAEMILR